MPDGEEGNRKAGSKVEGKHKGELVAVADVKGQIVAGGREMAKIGCATATPPCAGGKASDSSKRPLPNHFCE